MVSTKPAQGEMLGLRFVQKQFIAYEPGAELTIIPLILTALITCHQVKFPRSSTVTERISRSFGEPLTDGLR